MDEKRSYALPLVIVVLLLLPCLYVGSYLALVKRGFVDGNISMAGNYSAIYSVGGDHSSWFFYPIHRLDRTLRPSYWTYDERQEIWERLINDLEPV